jgi:hypothetical protein
MISHRLLSEKAASELDTLTDMGRAPRALKVLESVIADVDRDGVELSGKDVVIIVEEARGAIRGIYEGFDDVIEHDVQRLERALLDVARRKCSELNTDES